MMKKNKTMEEQVMLAETREECMTASEDNKQEEKSEMKEEKTYKKEKKSKQ